MKTENSEWICPGNQSHGLQNKVQLSYKLYILYDSIDIAQLTRHTQTVKTHTLSQNNGTWNFLKIQQANFREEQKYLRKGNWEKEN